MLVGRSRNAPYEADLIQGRQVIGTAGFCSRVGLDFVALREKIQPGPVR
jgi:hypothetical protein